jgi:hypothetical protein
VSGGIKVVLEAKARIATNNAYSIDVLLVRNMSSLIIFMLLPATEHI